MARIPDYEKYSIAELYQALDSIAVDRYPEIFAALKAELDTREPTSRVELEDCYYRLDKKRWPEYEERLRLQIERMGAGTRLAVPVVTEKNKYRTFWRRVFAQIVDALIFVIPALVALSVIAPKFEDPQLVNAYVNEALQFMLLAYFIVMHARYGQTLGKMATGVRVMDVSEERPVSWFQAVMRDSVPLVLALASTIFLLAFGTRVEDGGFTGTSALVANSIGFIMASWALAELITMLFNRKRRAVHDFIAGTVVVRAY